MLSALTTLFLVQSACDVLLADSVGDQLVRLADFTGDGLVRDAAEASALWRESSDRTPRALAVRAEGGVPALYWIDSAKDRIHRGEDINANGTIELFERTVVRNSGALDGASTARALAFTADGASWWCSDAGLRGLFRMRDLDGDGLFAGLDELEVLVGATSGGHPLETSLGLRPMNTGHLTELVSEATRVVAYTDGPDELMAVFEDLDGNGSLLEAGESRLFLNASGKNPLMPQNADWAGGALRSLVIPASGGGSFFGRLSLIAVDDSGITPVWYMACDSAHRTPYDTNEDSLGLNGLIYRGLDQNGDGDLQDAGEVRLFYDGSHTSNQPMLEQIVALDFCGGALFAAFNEGDERYVARFFDGDSSGTVDGFSEAEFYWFDSLSWQGEAPFEQGPAQVRDMVAIPAGGYERPNPLFEVLGPGCEYTQFGLPPTIHGVGQAVIGARTFKVELRSAAAGSYTILLAGDDFPAWFLYFLPANLGFMGWPNCYQYLNPTWLRRKWTTGTVGDPIGGYAKHSFDIPMDTELIGLHMRMQWIVYDWFGGISYSAGGEVEIEAPQ